MGFGRLIMSKNYRAPDYLQWNLEHGTLSLNGYKDDQYFVIYNYSGFYVGRDGRRRDF